MTDPADAYMAAKAARDARIKAENSEAARIESLPERANTKLLAICESLKSGLPAELSLESEQSKGGLEGKRGITGFFLKLKEHDKIVAQMALTCRDDEVVVCKGFPPDRDKRPEKLLGQFPLHVLDEGKAKRMLSELITQYLS